MNGFVVRLIGVGSPCMCVVGNVFSYHCVDYKTHSFKLMAESDRIFLEADLFQT